MDPEKDLSHDSDDHDSPQDLFFLTAFLVNGLMTASSRSLLKPKPVEIMPNILPEKTGTKTSISGHCKTLLLS